MKTSLFTVPNEHVVVKVAVFVIALAMYFSLPTLLYRLLLCGAVIVVLLDPDPESNPSPLSDRFHSPFLVRVITYPILLLAVGIVTAGSLGYF